jgi:hypothetical protein
MSRKCFFWRFGETWFLHIQGVGTWFRFMFKYGITNPKDIHLKNNLIDIIEATLNVIIRKRKRVVPRLKIGISVFKK